VVGEQLGSYKILREIGRGGMGSVWLGEHVELGHRVAIKVLLPQSVREGDSVQRFFNEAKAAARVRSPGIVQIVDFGRSADGAPFIAMELLVGETLRSRLRAQGQLTIDDAATITRQVATTLAAAHEAGIVHRDLKPDNIMMVPDPEVSSGERPKILDFGIAKLAEGLSGSSVQTRTGSLLGTPHYMSPEQCRGHGEVDGRTDVYALGCILFELVCGRPPFVSEGLGEIVGMHQFVAAPSPASIRADVPPWMEAVILRALAKDPATRFASMEEMADALEAGGAPAARTARGSGDYTPDSAGADTTIALAETVSSTDRGTQPDTGAQGSEVGALAADAQRRATEMAEQLAREHQAKTGRKGITVIAVAVVVLASVALFVKLQGGGGAAEPRVSAADKGDKATAGVPEDKPKPVEQGGGGSGSQVTRPDPGLTGRVAFGDAGVIAIPLSTDDSFDALFAGGEHELVLEKAEHILATDPDNAEAHAMAAIAACHLGNAALARRHYPRVHPAEHQAAVRERCAELGVKLPR
jgi:hypothetical protein